MLGNAMRKDLRIIRDDEVPSLDRDSIGAVIYWNAHGSVSYEKLKEKWLSEGMDEKLLPELPGPKTALSRAAKDMEEKRFMARPAGGKWLFVEEKVRGQDDLEYSTEAKVSLNPAGQLDIEPENVEPAFKEQLQAAYRVHLTHLSRTDLSLWLVKMASYVGATTLRESGGFYFVPSTGLSTWRTISRTIEAVSRYEMQEIPAGRGLSVAKAVLSGLAHEMKTAVEEMERDLLSGSCGSRALNARAKRCDELLDKVSDYEPVIGQSLNDIRTSIGDMQSRLAAASLALSDE